MTVSIVQSKQGTWHDSGVAFTEIFSGTPASGNTLVAFLFEGEHAASVIDSAGWAKLTTVSTPTSIDTVSIWTKVAGPLEPTGVHVPSPGFSQGRLLHLYEVSGIVDVYGTATDATPATITGPTLAATATGILLAGIVGRNQTYVGPATITGTAPLVGSWPAQKDSPGRTHGWSGTHTVTAGSYTPTATVTVQALTGSAGMAAVTLKAIPSTVPVADFAADVTGGQIPLTVHFTDLTTNVPTSWAWTFGDGATSTSQNPTHVYSVAGNYDVTLTATNASGSDAETKTLYISATTDPPFVPPEPAGVLLEIYAHAPGSARWDVAKWDEDIWGEAGWRDVTPYGVTVDIDWGSSRPELGILSTPDAASWAVDYFDPERVLDPANAEGPYFGDLQPYLPIRVSHRSTVVRQGYVSGISHSYRKNGLYGYMRGADNISLLANAMVPSDSTLPDTLYARAVAAISAAGLTVSVAAPLGSDPAVSPWITGAREWSVWEWIKDAAQEVLHIPIVDRLGTVTFRPWASPLLRARVLGSDELIDLTNVTDWSGMFSVVQAREDDTTIVERALTPPPRYGARTYTRDEMTIDPGDWADAVLADRGLPSLLWKPGDVRPLTALSAESLATIEAVELISIEYPEASPAITLSGVVVGGSIHIEGKRDAAAIWVFNYELAQTATQPLTLDGGTPTDYLTTESGTEYLYPDGSA